MVIPKSFRLSVAFNAEGGFIGRACGAAECGRFFKVHKDDLKVEMHCPYCGLLFNKNELLTADQAAYVRRVVDREVTPVIRAEVQALFRSAFKGPNWTFTPGPPQPIPPAPEPPIDPSTDSELQCPDCSVRFQVDGIFGYCPGCRSENLLLYDANLAIIRRELSNAGDSERKLRHAYADLVSTFEIFCRKEARRRGLPLARWQNLEAAREAFIRARHSDILATLTATENLDLRRAFQKRHVSEHNDGIIDDRYINAVPEDAHLLGQRATLQPAELEAAAMALRKVIAVIVDAR